MLEFIKNPAERTRFLKFCVVGAIGFVVDFGVMNLLLHFTGNVKFASTVSFIAAVISNFLWNRYWTYPDSREKPVAQQLAAQQVCGPRLRGQWGRAACTGC